MFTVGIDLEWITNLLCLGCVRFIATVEIGFIYTSHLIQLISHPRRQKHSHHQSWLCSVRFIATVESLTTKTCCHNNLSSLVSSSKCWFDQK